MKRLIIQDLDYCQCEKGKQNDIQGGFITFSIGFFSGFALSPAGNFTAGFAAGAGYAIGDNNPQVIISFRR